MRATYLSPSPKNESRALGMFPARKYTSIRVNLSACLYLSLLLTACGTHYPHMQEAWEDPNRGPRFQHEIKEKIFCEIVNSIKFVNSYASRKIADKSVLPIPYYYGVQAEINLQVSENSNLSPSIVYNPLIGGSTPLNLGFGGNLSSTATRTDILNSYWDVGRIAKPNDNLEACPPQKIFAQNSSLLTEPNLGISDFLLSAAYQASQTPSSKPPAGKDFKTDVYSYQIKFEVVSSGNANPSYQLKRVSGNTSGSPFLSAGRTRAHYLLLTFGPNEIIDPNKIPDRSVALPGSPSQAAINAHLASQIGIAVQNGISSFRQ